MTDSSPHTHTHAQTCPLTSEASKIEERPCGDLLQLLTPHFLAVIQKKKSFSQAEDEVEEKKCACS